MTSFLQTLTPPEGIVGLPQKAQSLHLPSAELPGVGQTSILPIERLRDEAYQLFQGKGIGAKFRSSGTTQATRSRSFFSPVGLSAYERVALHTAKAVFSHLNIDQLQLYSLIPSPQTWPTSSLARMIEWFSSFAQLHYLEHASYRFDSPLPAGKEPSSQDILIGTAFHFILSSQSGTILPLSKSKRWATVFETGGTKGKTRAMRQNAYLKLLADSYLKPNGKVISEYGMCELASQAYRIVTTRQIRSETAEYEPYYFPSWVKTFVYTEEGQYKTDGQGLLTVWDSTRLDYPWPMRTEDVVDLQADGGFLLLGRSKAAPAKGCSLLVSDISADQKAHLNDTTQGPTLPAPRPRRSLTYAKPPPPLADRCKWMHAFWQHQVASCSRFEAWERELSELHQAFALPEETQRKDAINQMARASHKDLQACLPQDDSGWQAAYHSSGLDRLVPGKKALILAPRSHSLASLGLLSLLVVGNKSLAIRVPENCRLLAHILEELITYCPWGNLAVYEESLRIGRRFCLPEDIGQMFAFGSDDTLKWLSENCDVPLQGYGDSLAVSYLTDNQARHLPDLKAALYDLSSLYQAGCMSSRCLFIKHRHLEKNSGLQDIVRNVSAIIEQWGLSKKRIHVYAPSDRLLHEIQSTHPEVAVKRLGRLSKALAPSTSSSSSSAPSIALIFVDDWGQMKTLLEPLRGSLLRFYASLEQNRNRCRELGEIARMCAQMQLIHRPLGYSQRPKWDGYHDQKPWLAHS